MLPLQEVSDRLEIQDLLARYCEAIDSRTWDALDDIFTVDAVIDYTEAGGAKGSVPEIKAYLEKALELFSGMQHMIGLPLIQLCGDTAKVRTALYNPMIFDNKGAPETFFVGMWYRDVFTRTDAGWRISERYEEACYFQNLPKALGG